MTTEQDIYQTKYGFGKVVKVGWEQYRKHFMSIVMIFLIVYLPIRLALSFIPTDYFVRQFGPDLGIRIYGHLDSAAQGLVGVVATVSLAKLIEAYLLGQPITWKEAFRHALSRWPALLGTGFLGFLIVFGMTLLLIVPGIIMATYYLFAVYAIGLRGLSWMPALNYSKRIVKGQGRQVFSVFFVFSLMEILAGITVGFVVGIMVYFPLTLFLPDNRLTQSLGETVSLVIVTIATAFGSCMRTVFFLNREQMHLKGVSDTGRTDSASERFLS